jgi:hypothetical protein
VLLHIAKHTYIQISILLLRSTRVRGTGRLGEIPVAF